MSSSSSVEFELILLGEVGVGKTSLFLYFQNDKFIEEQHRSTVGIDQMLKTVEIDGQEVTVKVHDTGGSEKFRSITSGFYRRANIAVLIYSVEDQYTLDVLSDWITECQDNNVSPDDLMLVLVGNKCDLENEIEPDKVEAFCRHNGVSHFYLVSAKTGKNVNEMFEGIVKTFYQKTGSKKTNIAPKINNTIVVDKVKEKQPEVRKEKKSCCN